MSNYLNNLVAKSLNQTEVVQPRLASLFELLPMSPGSVAGQAFSIEQLIGTAMSDEAEFEAQSREGTSTVLPIESPRERRSRTPDLRSPPITPQPLSNPFPTEETSPTPPPHQPSPLPVQTIVTPLSVSSNPLPTEETSPTLPPDQPSSAPVQTIVTPLSVRGEQLPPPSASLEPFPVNREATDASQPRHPTEQPRLPVLEPKVIQPSVSEPIVSSKEPSPTAELPPELFFLQTTNPVVPKASALPNQPQVPAPAESTAIPGSSSTPPSSTAVSVGYAQIAPSVKSVAQNFMEGGDTPQPSPTIQVTIGRIEVRATPPPATSLAKSRPASPAMSLEEYLRQRGGAK
jgi:hypothetical protein